MTEKCAEFGISANDCFSISQHNGSDINGWLVLLAILLAIGFAYLITR